MAWGSDRAQQTVQRLQADVTSGRWPVNGRIPTEAELAAEFGVGRSTIREAIRSLAHLGLLEPAPGRGTFVRSLSPVRGVLSDFAASHTWSDILAVRRALEVQAAELAAAGADEEGLERLRQAHQADLENAEGIERGRTPGQFHALVVELAGNRLLAELYAGVSAAIRAGLAAGAIESSESAGERQRDHGALLAALVAGNVRAAGALAAEHAEHDLKEVASS